MTRILFVLIISMKFTVSFAQNSRWIQGGLMDNTFQKHQSVLNISASGFYNSNFITNGLADKFLFGGYIDNNLKNKSRENLNGQNYFNLEFESSINYYCNIDTLAKQTKNGLYFGASLKGIANAEISDDAFNLILYGNRPFGEERILLNGNSFYQTIFQNFQFGMYNKKTFSFISLNIFNGAKFLNINTENTFIQTKYNTIDGFLIPDEINTEYDINYASTQGKTNLIKSKGVGFGISGTYNIPLNLIKDRASFLQFEIEDLGFIKWHNGINTADTVGKFSFRGFQSTGLFNFDNASLDANNIIDSILPNVSEKSKIYLLPTKYSISFSSQITDKIYTSAKIFYRSNCENNYGINISGDYKFSKNFMLGGELNLFAFRDPNLILNTAWYVKRCFFVSANILNPIGFINDNSTSKGILIKFTKAI